MARKPCDHRGKRFKRIVYPGPIMSEYGLKVHEILPPECRMKLVIRFLRNYAFLLGVFIAIFLGVWIYLSIRSLSVRSPTPVSFFEIAFQSPTYISLVIVPGIMAGLVTAFDYKWTWKSNAVAIKTLLGKGFCPSCGYKVSKLIAEADGIISCPECGCGWRGESIGDYSADDARS